MTAIVSVIAGVMAVPALGISIKALQVSEQQAAQAAQQLANRVTSPPSSLSFVRPGFEHMATLPGVRDDDGQVLFPVRIRNANSVPVVVEGLIQETVDAGGPFLEPEFLILNLPACTEGVFEIAGSERQLDHAKVQLYTKNALDGRHWSVPDPGQQARLVEMTVTADDYVSLHTHRKPRQSKVITQCA
ncbi:hypothetical protein [Nonomuraea soli]|uniref:Uncharacterized protein n=1 Tax=Nonomuraea soli TaxID=1032476 RepID=A0A7W0CSA3_9ACTN|nr:hypothetical protein [Nonomuraea soli]MBA2896421.1 hypothetical protein [Nonomuraea soli]